MANVEGLTQVKNALERLRKQYISQGSEVSCIVGYTANYAFYVHEKIEMKWKGLPRKGRKGRPGRGRYWDPQGRAQAKFLEQPFREMREELSRIVTTVAQRTKSIEQGLYVAGLRLQRASQLLCPVDTGNLKASAFTMLVDGQGQAYAKVKPLGETEATEFVSG